MARFLAILVLLIAGCTGRHVAPPGSVERHHDDDRLAELDRTRTAGPTTDYCLGPDDVLRIDVFGWPALSTLDVRVSPAGVVNLPILGDVPAGGRTEAELRADIERRLRNGYMRDPHVKLLVERFLSQRVSVTGAVMRPGLYSLTRDRRTVHDVLSQAGGLSEQSGGVVEFSPSGRSGCGQAPPSPRSGAALLAAAARPADAAAAPIRFAIGDNVPAGGVDPLSTPMWPGDSLVVTRSRFLVDGWVANPGLYDGKGDTTALDAESIAGGALFPADLHHVQIVRAQDDGSKKVITVDLADVGRGDATDVRLVEGDVVRFPASPIRMVPYSVYWILKNVFPVGAGLFPNT